MLSLLFSDYEKDLLICDVPTEIQMREFVFQAGAKRYHEHKSDDIFSEDFSRFSEYFVAVSFCYLIHGSIF